MGETNLEGLARWVETPGIRGKQSGQECVWRRQGIQEMAGGYFERTKRRHRGQGGLRGGQGDIGEFGVSERRQRAKEEVWMHQRFRKAAPGVRKASMGVPPRHMVWEGHEELAHKKWRMHVPPFLGVTSNTVHPCGEFFGREGREAAQYRTV